MATIGDNEDRIRDLRSWRNRFSLSAAIIGVLVFIMIMMVSDDVSKGNRIFISLGWIMLVAGLIFHAWELIEDRISALIAANPSDSNFRVTSVTSYAAATGLIQSGSVARGLLLLGVAMIFAGSIQAGWVSAPSLTWDSALVTETPPGLTPTSESTPSAIPVIEVTATP